MRLAVMVADVIPTNEVNQYTLGPAEEYDDGICGSWCTSVDRYHDWLYMEYDTEVEPVELTVDGELRQCHKHTLRNGDIRLECAWEVEMEEEVRA